MNPVVGTEGELRMLLRWLRKCGVVPKTEEEVSLLGNERFEIVRFEEWFFVRNRIPGRLGIGYMIEVRWFNEPIPYVAPYLVDELIAQHVVTSR